MGQRRFEDVEAFIELFVGNDERNENTHYVAVSAGGDGDKAVFVAVLRDFFGGFGVRLARRLVFDQFDGTHRAEAAYVADDCELLLPSPCALLELAAKMRGAG